ncbi:hypothetical protein PoB_003154800 [Plakobranchus ocellatus]|uniref:Secreted protein n=1 Tax=Plakobranchus ocellatus TaxID=259542 RepID=A0AAV4AE15_9GAST|nr:hypothetical protein PoB_003154800 [Plakobranchus ocellatus]
MDNGPVLRVEGTLLFLVRAPSPANPAWWRPLGPRQTRRSNANSTEDLFRVLKRELCHSFSSGSSTFIFTPEMPVARGLGNTKLCHCHPGSEDKDRGSRIERE